VAAQIPEDQPGHGGEVPALVVPDVLAQRVTVAEDDRDRGGLRAVDLDVQRHPVVGEHDSGPPPQLAERLVRLGIGLQPQPADRDLLRRERGSGPRGHGRADGQPGDAGDPPPTGHELLLP